MPQRNLVLFDLEWNIGYQPYTFNYHGVQQTFRGEIIEIGAVKIDEDANVLDTFSIHLRPRIFRKLQHHIAKVTGLTQADLDRGEPIVQGLRRFMQWCGPDAEFAEWGMDDVPVLKQNLFLCNLDESRPTQWYDLQQIFLREHPRKEGEGMTLESVVTRMGIPMERPFHDALSDTLYTADVCRKLDLRAGLAAYPTEEESLLFVGHVGVLLTAEDGTLHFVEKVAFQEPYRLVKIQNRTELSDYLMEKYDTAWGQDTTRPFIMENDSLMAE